MSKGNKPSTPLTQKSEQTDQGPWLALFKNIYQQDCNTNLNQRICQNRSVVARQNSDQTVRPQDCCCPLKKKKTTKTLSVIKSIRKKSVKGSKLVQQDKEHTDRKEDRQSL